MKKKIKIIAVPVFIMLMSVSAVYGNSSMISGPVKVKAAVSAVSNDYVANQKAEYCSGSLWLDFMEEVYIGWDDCYNVAAGKTEKHLILFKINTDTKEKEIRMYA